jgi:hypothetical protein
MPHTDQADLFVGEAQAELFTADPVADRADPDKVRARLHRVLAEGRAARTLPWDAGRVALDRTVVPQMTLWLPAEEAAQLGFAFHREAARRAGKSEQP